MLLGVLALVRFAVLAPNDRLGIRRMLRDLVPDFALDEGGEAPRRQTPASGSRDAEALAEGQAAAGGAHRLSPHGVPRLES